MKTSKIDTTLSQLEAAERQAFRRTKLQKRNVSSESLLAYIFGGSNTVIDHVTTVVPRGSSTTASNQKSNTSRSRGHTSFGARKVTDESERIKRGLFNTKPDIDYGIVTIGDIDYKTCKCCNNTFNVHNFSKSKAAKDGYQSVCKDCDATRKKAVCVTTNKQLRQSDIENNVTKRCNECHETKHVAEFNYNHTSFRGSMAVCKCCLSAKAKK